MATIIAVHGTFAHAGSDTAPHTPATPEDAQWWQQGSVFARDLVELLDSGAGKPDVTHFTWSGANSELDRRQAGKDLLDLLLGLEARQEPYAIIGHSHGGSVISAALLRAAARKKSLPNLKRWITVGTPFVDMRRETWLFTRLDLMRRVIFVASMMLFAMFAVYLIAQVLSGKDMVLGGRFPGVFVVTGLMMSAPALVFYLVLKAFDGRSLLNYRRRVIARAREYFAGRWVSLAHRDDEAIQGLTFLPGAKLFFFDKHFAVPTLTLVSVFALPLIYISVLTSSSTMVGIADWLKTEVYEARVQPGAEDALRGAARMRESARGVQGMTPEQRRAMWQSYREQRRALEARHGDLAAAERSLRFKQRFLERDDAVCENGKLCGNGHDFRINAALLLHVVTDELSWRIGGDEIGGWRTRWLWSIVIPALLVPVIFGVVSLLLMLAIRAIAKVISHGLSIMLNALTNSEVKRSAFGNDTEGEIALGAVDRPLWIERSPPRLPDALGDKLADYANVAASRSLAKFRRAIGQLANADPKHTADTAITTYFTWKELVHAAYFDVPEFRKLVAQALARSEPFAPSAIFRSDPAYAETAQWLAEIEGAAPSGAKPAEKSPTEEDTAAVAAAVASTVKAEP